MTAAIDTPTTAPSGALCPTPEALSWALGYEWLETNGLGGYASATVADAHTRKYHGLLVSRPRKPLGPHVLLAKLETAVVLGGVEHALSTNLYPGAVHPRGHERIESFTAEPCPTTIYRLGDIALKRSVMMPRDQDAVLIRYEIVEGNRRLQLRLMPLLACRNAHALTHENLAMRGRVFGEGNRYKISPYPGMPDLHFEPDPKAAFYPGPHWHRNLEYPREAERGFEHHEDLFCPGMFEKRLAPGTPFVMRVGTAASRRKAGTLWRLEEQRRREVRLTYENRIDTALARLKAHAEQFLVRDGARGLAVIAGYPWFECWGRDAMIATPGLCFYTDRVDEGIRVLRTFAGHAKNGLIPNFLSPDGKHAYNSADASLWFAWAVGELLAVTGDAKATARHFLKPLEKIVEAIDAGRAKGLRPDPSGLLRNDAQMTWMDAQVDGRPVTPRAGLAVDINALWIHALNVLLKLGASRPKRWHDRMDARLQRARAAFAPAFWLPEQRYLADVITPEGPDASLRPNQIFAVSLPLEALAPEQRRGVVEAVRRDLSTSKGLRTLSPDDSRYCGRYEGDPAQRDGAYHQGTVWPWLIGHYVQARLNEAPDPALMAAELTQLYRNLMHDHLNEYGIGSIAEIFDGDNPHRPAGCIAQAWSVGEVIRACELIQRAQGPVTPPVGAS